MPRPSGLRGNLHGVHVCLERASAGGHFDVHPFHVPKRLQLWLPRALDSQNLGFLFSNLSFLLPAPLGVQDPISPLPGPFALNLPAGLL